MPASVKPTVVFSHNSSNNSNNVADYSNKKNETIPSNTSTNTNTNTNMNNNQPSTLNTIPNTNFNNPSHTSLPNMNNNINNNNQMTPRSVADLHEQYNPKYGVQNNNIVNN